MVIEPNAVFGDLLRRARRAAGLTQEELAEKAGLSTRAIGDLERSINRTPRRDTLDMLVEALTGAAIMIGWESKVAADRAQAMNEQALSIGLSLPDPPLHIFWNYVTLGHIAMRHGDIQSGHANFEAMLDVATRLGNIHGLGIVFHNPAQSAFVRGNLELATERSHEALRYYRSAGATWGSGQF